MKTVLLVDDEENLRFALSTWLSGHGLTVLTAATGEEAFLDLRGPGEGAQDAQRLAGRVQQGGNGADALQLSVGGLDRHHLASTSIGDLGRQRPPARWRSPALKPRCSRAVAADRDAVAARSVRSVAVSPLIGGRAVKGPLDRMLTRMAGGTSPAQVTQCYEGIIDALVIDRADAPAEAGVPLRPRSIVGAAQRGGVSRVPRLQAR